jgi:site-specific recombinase XerC
VTVHALNPREATALTLAEWAPMMREAVKDRSYVTETGLGRDVDHFLTYFKTERGKRDSTCTLYEYCLSKLAVYYADLDLQAFDGKHGTNMIRDFLREYYADVAGGTWNTRIATLKSFFKWAFEESRIETNPAAIIRYRTVAESERQAHAPDRILKITTAQTERRDRIAVQLLGRLGLRRSELSTVQFKHLDRDRHELTVFGKGGTVKRLPLPADLFEQFQREALERLAHPEEFLLYPQKIGRVGVYPDVRMGVIWEDRLSPLSLSGIDKWWGRMLRTAGVERFPMHEMRHSAGTNFWRETRDLRLTQRLMRHKSIRTTADTYLHDDATDLADAMSTLPGWEVEG